MNIRLFAGVLLKRSSYLLPLMRMFQTNCRFILFKSEGTENWSTSTRSAKPISRNIQRLMEVPEERKINVKLLDDNGNEIGIMRKSAARNLAFSKELILVDLPLPGNVDLATLKESLEGKPNEEDLQPSYYTEVCQLMTQQKFSEHSKKEKEQRKLDRVTADHGESEVKITTEMGKKHFDSKLKQIKKWIDKRHLVKVQLVLNKNSTKLELDTMKEKILSSVSEAAVVTKEKYSASSVYLELSPIVHNVTEEKPAENS